MKNPLPFAGAHVKAANVALVVFERLWRPPFAKRCTNDHNITTNNGRALKPQFARDQIGKHRLIIVQFEINFAVGAKRRNARTRFGIQRNQFVTRRYVQNA